MLDRPRICQYPAARVLVAVLFLLQAGAFAQSQAPMVPSPALLTNERHPLPGTVTGGVPAGDGSVPVYQALANSGVRTVIDLRTEAEVPTETALLAAAAGLDYRRLPVAGEAELDLASARALGSAIHHCHGKDTRIERGLADINGLLELKDVTDVVNRSWNYVAVGAGRDLQWWKEFFSVVRMVGYNGWVSLEMEDFTMSTEAGIQSSIDALQATISR